MSLYQEQKGFTLVEILISILLIGMVFVGILYFYSHSIRTSSELRVQVTAQNLARERLEFLKRYDNSNLGRNSATWQTIDNAPPTIQTINGIRYTIDTTILDPTASFSDPNYIPVRVTVKWTYKNIEKEISMDSCYVGNYN